MPQCSLGLDGPSYARGFAPSLAGEGEEKETKSHKAHCDTDYDGDRYGFVFILLIICHSIALMAKRLQGCYSDGKCDDT